MTGWTLRWHDVVGWIWNETVEWNVDWPKLESSWVCNWLEGPCRNQWAWPFGPPAYEQLERVTAVYLKWVWHLASV